MNTPFRPGDDSPSNSPQNASDLKHYRYKVGGSLAGNDSTYIFRQGDAVLYQAIQSEVFCHVLGPRQVGKSSLRIRTSDRLRQAGYRCASLQATDLGGAQRTLKFWDKQLISMIWDSLHPQASEVLLQWFQTTEKLSAPQRLEHFVRDLIFADLRETPIVIFIDEIDYLLDIPAIVSQFFGWIAKCYSLRTNYGDYREYHPLSFVIVGTAIATDLAGSVPACIDLFHSARAIALNNFQPDQLQPLYPGFASIAHRPATLPAALLAAIMHWTNGQPFLTQKLCHILFHRLQNMDPPLALSPQALSDWIAQVVQQEIIRNWRQQDEPIHFRAIRDRLITSPRCAQLCRLYQQVLANQPVFLDNSVLQQELLLTGLVLPHRNQLQIGNEIYRQVFDRKTTSLSGPLPASYPD